MTISLFMHSIYCEETKKPSLKEKATEIVENVKEKFTGNTKQDTKEGDKTMEEAQLKHTEAQKLHDKAKAAIEKANELHNAAKNTNDEKLKEELVAAALKLTSEADEHINDAKKLLDDANKLMEKGKK